MRVGIAQINPTVGAFSSNSDKILTVTERAKEQAVDLLVFPELTLTGYPPEDLLFKEDFIHANLTALSRIRRKIRGIDVIVGFVDRDARGRIFNAAQYIAGGKARATYHKMCLPNYGVFDEKRYFHEGEMPKIVSSTFGRVGLSICEDIWNSESTYFGKLAKQGCRILANLSASPYHYRKDLDREAMVKARARNLKAYVVYANLVGGQDELVFDGSSLIASPDGKIVARAMQFEEDLLIQDIPLQTKKRSSIVKPAWSPTVSRAGHSNPVAEIYEALCMGTRDYVLKNHFQKVVIGLSGGIDSSLVAAIAVDAIGAGNVVGVTMPSRFSSKDTVSDAKLLARNLKIECMEIPILELHRVYIKTLGPFFKGGHAGVTEENLQARIRGNIVMALSNKFGYLVLTTGNKSEIAVGYCTLYGDMAGGFAVIKDVPKTVVYKLCRYRNSLGSTDLIPRSVLKRAPSAELRAGQKDSDSLPEYSVLDPILESYVEDMKPVSRIRVKKASKQLIKKMVRKVDLNEYKRRQGPIGIKITPRAFGRDRRMPVTSAYYSG